MTFYLVHRDGKALVATDRPILKMRDADRLADAAALLTRADTLETQAARRRDEAEREARQQGFAQGTEEGRRAFVSAVADLTGQVEAWRQDQERQVAALALAALRHMIDDIGDEAMMAALALRAAGSVSAGSEAQVHVAPELVEMVTAALAEEEGTRDIPVRADPNLARHECRVVTNDGRIIADLSVQLAEIEKRWSLTHVD
jgi:type III secretion protein L